LICLSRLVKRSSKEMDVTVSSSASGSGRDSGAATWLVDLGFAFSFGAIVPL